MRAILQSSSEFLVGHIQVALRLLNAGVSEHMLNDADVHAVSQQAACTLVPEIVQAEIDLPQLFAVPLSARPATQRLDAVRHQPKCLPGCLDVRLIRTGRVELFKYRVTKSNATGAWSRRG
jgi:hypothetical protein